MRKRQYDKKVRHTALCEGDRVLVRNMTKHGDPGKLQSYWEREICYNWLSARYCLPHAKILNTNTLSIILRCYVSPLCISLQQNIGYLINYQGGPSQLTLRHMAVSKQENKVCDSAEFHQLPLHNNQFL